MILKVEDRAVQLLGMRKGTASHRLNRLVLFHLVCQLSLDICFVCKQKIASANELSIEHKEPWESSNRAELFWDLNNIAFSHRKCNRPHVYRGGNVPRVESPEGMGWCYRCKDHHDTEKFSKDSGHWNGLRSWCKDCEHKYFRKYRNKNRGHN